MTTRPGYVWDATASAWVEIGQAAVVSPIKYQTSAPSSPATGDIWIDSDDDVPSVDSTLYYRWTKTMSGGETSLSGTDNNSLALKYTAGYESVFINGVLQVRGSDYVATTGTTVTGLTALTASDVVTVESIVAYSVGDTYTQSQMTSLLDAKSPVSTTGLVLINTTTFTTQASVSFNDVFSATYNNYLIHFALDGSTTQQDVNFRFRVASADNSSANYSRTALSQVSTTVSGQSLTAQTSWLGVGSAVSTQRQYADLTVFNPFATQYTAGMSNVLSTPNGATYQDRRMYGTTVTTSYTGFTLIPAAGTITGTVSVYGYKIQEIGMTRARDVSTPTALVLISSTTIGSAVSSVTVNNAFSSTYDNYKILISGGVASTAQNMTLQLGSTATGYYWSYAGITFGNVGANGNGSNSTSFIGVGVGTTTATSANFDLESPFLSDETVVRFTRVDVQTGGSSATGGGFLNNTTSYTGFTIAPVSGTYTGGTIRVYGYKNS